MSTLWKKITRNCKLISLPETYLRLKTAIENPEYCQEEVADAIRSDPALTIRVLKLVNSPFFGLPSKIETVFRALNLLGAQQIHDLALATCVSDTFSRNAIPSVDMHEFWRRSVYCGLAAQNLAQQYGLIDNERLFICGLLFDLGHLVLHQSIPEQMQAALHESRRKTRPLVEVERDIIKLDYARVGAMLMRQWNFPTSLIETNEFHPEPMRAQQHPLETAMVHIAMLIADDYMGEGIFGEGLLTPHAIALERTELTIEECLAAMEQIEDGFEAILHTISPLNKAS
ncbi:MAG: HDOD domain-containing protein [Candidatus Thiodiazotropha sp.]|jgi:HD-like signal output (HDOD) protein